MFLQFGGQLFLPNSPPPSISEKVNPYSDSIRVVVSHAPKEFSDAKIQAEKELRVAQAAMAKDPSAKPAMDEAKAKFDAADRAEDANTPVAIRVPKGQLAIFGTTVVLMALLTWLVLKTPAGRAMRAVSHDFDTASLMGISVSKTVTFTFAIGSALAGAGAMMNATSMGTPLTSFYGLMPGVKAFVAAVLGGIGSIPGAVLGGLLMGIAETLVTWLGWSNARDAVAFVILIAVLLFRPGGLMGSSKVEKV
jgi:branched-chain amino acid transport system permease protein